MSTIALIRGEAAKLPRSVRKPTEDPSREKFASKAKLLGLYFPGFPCFWDEIHEWQNDPTEVAAARTLAENIQSLCINILNDPSQKVDSYKAVEFLRDTWPYTPDGEPKNNLEKALIKAVNENPLLGTVPNRRFSIWYSGFEKNRDGETFPESSCKAILEDLLMNPECKHEIMTDDVGFVKTLCKNVFDKNGTGKDVIDRLKIYSWEEPFKKNWGEYNDLKPIIYKAVAWERSRNSGCGFAPQSASDASRIVGQIGPEDIAIPPEITGLQNTEGGQYFDGDAVFRKASPLEVKAPFGVLMGAGKKGVGSGMPLAECDCFENQPWAFERYSAEPFKILKNLAELLREPHGRAYMEIKSGMHDDSDGTNQERRQGTWESGGTIAFLRFIQRYGLAIHRGGNGREVGGKKVLPANLPRSLVFFPEGDYYKMPPAGGSWHKPQEAREALQEWKTFNPWPEFAKRTNQRSQAAERPHSPEQGGPSPRAPSPTKPSIQR